jgi:hypothetical protein
MRPYYLQGYLFSPIISTLESLTCAALLSGSLRAEKYASLARPSAPDGPHARSLCPGCPVPDTFCAAAATAAFVSPIPRRPRECRRRRRSWFVPRVSRPQYDLRRRRRPPVAASIPRLSRHQPLPPAALPGTSTPH